MTGQEYWRKRFEALHEALLKDGEGSYADTEKIFAEARRSIEADLARWYMRLAKNNQVSLTEARKLLSKDELKEFHWTVEEYMKRGRENAATQQWMKELENASAKFHISRLEAIRIQMQQHLEELYGNYNDALDDTMRRLYSDGYYKTAYTLEQGFHTGFDVSRLNDKDIDTILARPWAADGKNFSTRIWGDKDKLMNTLQTELVQGLIRGDSLQKITKRFADKMGASQSNAKRLIYTESAYFAAAGEYQGMKELGVEKYEYLATLDSRTSEICQDMDGKIFKLSEYMPGTTAPPLHVHCRSTTVPYYGKGGTLRAARDAKNKTVYVPDMPYKDWKAIFVDKTQTLEKWKKDKAVSDKKQEVIKFSKMAAMAKARVDNWPDKDVQYSNIWKDPVTISDWDSKKDAIPKKKDYFEQQIQASTDVGKFSALLKALDDFDQKGKSYYEAAQEFQNLNGKIESLRDEIYFLEHGKKRDNPYSAERKANAKWFKTAKAADTFYRNDTGKVWQSATSEEKNAIFEYTAGSGAFNRPLSGFQKPYDVDGEGWEEQFFKGNEQVWLNYERKGDAIRRMTDLIGRSSYNADVWLRRGSTASAMESFLNLQRGALMKMTDKQLQNYVGASGTFNSFVSTGVAEGKGFNEEIEYKIYAPRGTEMMYAEPFSNYGLGSGRSWDGKAKQRGFSSEQECIIQRGATYKVAAVKKLANGNVEFTLEVHPENGYNKYQQDDSEWKGSRKDYKGNII